MCLHNNYTLCFIQCRITMAFLLSYVKCCCLFVLCFKIHHLLNKTNPIWKSLIFVPLTIVLKCLKSNVCDISYYILRNSFVILCRMYLFPLYIRKIFSCLHEFPLNLFLKCKQLYSIVAECSLCLSSLFHIFLLA